MSNENNKSSIDIATKYQVELNSKYSKQGNSNGNNTKESILNIIQKQSNSQKKGE